MNVILRTLGVGVVALVGLLLIALAFLFHPAWLVPVVVIAAFINMGLLLVVMASPSAPSES